VIFSSGEALAMAVTSIAAELFWPFDRRSLPAYILIGVMVASGLFLLWVTGFSVSPDVLPKFFSWPISAILAGWGLRRLGYMKFGGAMETMGILYGQGLSSFLCLVPLATMSAPLADHWLSEADQLLGFDWVAYAHATVQLKPLFWIVYKSFMWQPAVVAFTLFLKGQGDRGWHVVTAATVGLLFTVLLFPFVPASGSILYYGVDVSTPAPAFAYVLSDLKSGVRILDRSTFVGLVSFPSYHAAAAVIFSWGCWKTPLRWPVSILNVLMTLSAITMGAHYLIDIIAGAVIGVASVKTAVRLLPHPLVAEPSSTLRNSP
jgi:membrane-associated phospholipid phosphatase